MEGAGLTTGGVGFRAALAHQGIRVAMGAGAVLPRPWALGLFELGGDVVHLVERRGRERALRNLSFVFGESVPAGRLARRVYRDIGRNAAILARLEKAEGWELEELVEVTGFERLEAAMARGRGVIGITAHLGNWELLAAYLGRRGVPLTALAKHLFDRRLDERLIRIRARHGVASLLLSDPGWSRDAVRVLRRGGMLGVLMDLRCRRAGVVTDFLGRPARTAAGPARLAERTGALILPMACWMVDGGRYRIASESPIEACPSRAGTRGLEESTRECVRALERFIRTAPTQWVWMHDRWELGRA
jgi:KDO2-lipid IV(A) lauroyltransferase